MTTPNRTKTCQKHKIKNDDISYNLLCIKCGIICGNKYNMMKPNSLIYNLEVSVFQLIEDSKKINQKSKKNLKNEYYSKRLVIIEYLEQLNIRNNASISTFILSLAYIDSLMQNFEDLNQDLCVIACFLLAAKFNEKDPYIQSTHDFKSINKQRSFSNNEVKRYEIVCLILLNYKLNFITSFNLLESILCCGVLSIKDTDNFLYNNNTYQIDKVDSSSKNLFGFEESQKRKKFVEVFYSKAFSLLENVCKMNIYIDYHPLSIVCSIINILKIQYNIKSNWDTNDNWLSNVLKIDYNTFYNCEESINKELSKQKYNDKVYITEQPSINSSRNLRKDNLNPALSSNTALLVLENNNSRNRISINSINSVYMKPKPQRTIFIETEESLIKDNKQKDTFIKIKNNQGFIKREENKNRPIHVSKNPNLNASKVPNSYLCVNESNQSIENISKNNSVLKNKQSQKSNFSSFIGSNSNNGNGKIILNVEDHIDSNPLLTRKGSHATSKSNLNYVLPVQTNDKEIIVREVNNLQAYKPIHINSRNNHNDFIKNSETAVNITKDTQINKPRFFYTIDAEDQIKVNKEKKEPQQKIQFNVNFNISTSNINKPIRVFNNTQDRQIENAYLETEVIKDKKFFIKKDKTSIVSNSKLSSNQYNTSNNMTENKATKLSSLISKQDSIKSSTLSLIKKLNQNLGNMKK